MLAVMEDEALRDSLKACLESRGFTGPKDANQCLQYLFTDEFRLCLHNSEYVLNFSRVSIQNNSIAFLSMRPDKNSGIDEQTGFLRYGNPSFSLHEDLSEFFYLSVPTKYRYKFTDTKTKHSNKDALHGRVKNQWQQNIQPHYRVNLSRL